MPNRMLKESLLRSRTIAALSAEGERHFARLLLCADDYGCLEVTPEIIRGICYPLHPHITPEHVATWTAELVKVGLVQTWSDGDHQYAHFLKFDSHSGAAFTDVGGKTRNRRKTPVPPKSRNHNAESQTEPDGAKRSPVSVLVSVPVLSEASTNSEETLIFQHVSNRGGELKNHTAPKHVEHAELAYQVEVLNKCEGRTGREHPSEGSLRLIARHVPAHLIRSALGRMQDARLNRISDPEAPNDLTRYYLGTIKALCEEFGYRSPFGRKEQVA